MSAAWLVGNLLSFDTETTGQNPLTARIVEATCVEVGAEGVANRETWRINPGVPIPAAATAIHGITDTMAAGGLDPLVAVPAIVARLERAWAAGMPVVIFCAGYDLTVLAEEAERIAHDGFELGPVLDPIVIDRAMDPYRKGSRKLVDMAKHYGVRLDGAHSSDGDAMAAARIVWKQARVYWALAKHSLEEMQAYQRNAHATWAAGFNDYLRKQGKPADVSLEWPMRGRGVRVEIDNDVRAAGYEGDAC